MADEAITNCERSLPGVLNPDLYDQWYRDEAGPTDPTSSPVTTTSPPSWWQQRAAAHDLENTRRMGQLNLL